MEQFRIPAEIQGWFSEFQAALGQSPTDIIHHFVQLGVDDPTLNQEIGNDHGPLGWIYQNQRSYNQKDWGMLTPKTRHQMRLVLQRDLKSNDTLLQDCGKIVCKQYARRLLEHFLVAKPTWC